MIDLDDTELVLDETHPNNFSSSRQPRRFRLNPTFIHTTFTQVVVSSVCSDIGGRLTPGFGPPINIRSHSCEALLVKCHPCDRLGSNRTWHTKLSVVLKNLINSPASIWLSSGGQPRLMLSWIIFNIWILAWEQLVTLHVYWNRGVCLSKRGTFESRPPPSSWSLTLAVLAAGAPAVETVARVRVARREAGGRRGEGRVRERLPTHGPRVAGQGERCQSVLLRASAAGALVQIERSHVLLEEMKNEAK